MLTAPAGSDVVVIARSALMVMLRFAVAVAAAESVTFTVKLETPVALGVPVIAPVFAFTLNPVGSVPALMLHV